MNLNEIYNHIDENIEKHIEKIREFIQQPSISAENKGIKECAKMVRQYFRDLGCVKAELVETDRNPVVYGEYDAQADKTLCIYMMYDTQPFDDEKWQYSQGEIASIKPFAKCLIGRGAINTKGPLRAFLNALESIKNTGNELPVNLIFVAEGEEELGSPNLPQFVNKYQYKLKRADAVFFPSAEQDKKGKVILELGAKGVVYLELECSGKNWGRGPMEFDIHSSNKAWVDSPVWRMIHALETMTSENGNEVLIDGFYDNVKKPSKEDLNLINELEKTFDPETIKEINKVDKFVDDIQGRELLLKYLYSSTLNIDGIWSGYTGEGTKTVLPHQVTVKMDIRIVPDQNPAEIIPKIRKHLDKCGYSDIKIKKLASYDWAKTSVKEPIVHAMIQTYRSFGYNPEVWPHMGGSVPFYLFNKKPLNLPFVIGGLGHGGREHAPDEYVVIEGNEHVCGIATLEKSYVAMLKNYAEKRSIL